MGGQAALPWTPPAGTGSMESPAHEAPPQGPARPSAQIPCPCPSLVDRPTSAQGCLEVPEKPPGAPPTSSLNSILDPHTELPAQHRVSPGMRTPFLDPPTSWFPYLSDNHQAFGGHQHMWGPAGHTRHPALCSHPALTTAVFYCACFLQLRTFQAHCLQGLAVSTGVKAQLLSF